MDIAEIKAKLGDYLSKGLAKTVTISREGFFSQPYLKVWSQYFLSPFPGCCGLVVSHGSWLMTDKRGLGLGQYFHQERLSLMKVLGYSCGIATVVKGNTAETAILNKNGWTPVHE